MKIHNTYGYFHVVLQTTAKKRATVKYARAGRAQLLGNLRNGNDYYYDIATKQ